jgi:aryl-alcohol dehydrogenase-like predicted oxidoreductase
LSRSDAIEIVTEAGNLGFGGFDTAQDYPADPKIFSAAKGSKIFSKLSKGIDASDFGAVELSVRSSLESMGMSHFEGFSFHSIEQLFDAGQAGVKAMRNLVDSGLVKSWGVSLYTIDEFRKVLSMCAPNFVQAPVNFLDRSFLDPEVTSQLTDHEIGLQARSIFLQGALLLDSNQLPKKLSPLRGAMTQLDAISAEANLTRFEVLLRFVAVRPEVNHLIVGVNSWDHFQEAFQALSAAPFLEPLDWLGPEYAVDPDVIDPRNWDSL